jgi:hypothetical protein
MHGLITERAILTRMHSRIGISHPIRINLKELSILKKESVASNNFNTYFDSRQTYDPNYTG